MIKAILLDLDNTLLSNPDMNFASAFAQAFDTFAHPKGITTSDLHQSIRVLSRSRTGSESNRELMIRHLSETLSILPEHIDTILREFYDGVYPELADCVQPIAGASDLVKQLHQEGFIIVIATNPIYPAESVIQRMKWAGLPHDEKLYAFITSLDNMHFAKPDPAYYAEILGRIGVEPDETIMVGDSLQSDIKPAQSIGIQTYHISGTQTIQSFYEYLQNIASLPIHPHLMPSMVLPQLLGNIGALYGLLREVKPGFWHQRPDPNEWSIVQVICHLLTSEDNNERPRLYRILSENNPFITPQKPPGPNIPVCAEDGYEVAIKFKESRWQTLEFLNTLTAENWVRPARHSIFGLTTLVEMSYFTAQHDRLHLNQLCQTIGRCR